MTSREESKDREIIYSFDGVLYVTLLNHRLENEVIRQSIGSCGECYYAVNDCTLCEYHTKADADGDIFEFDIQHKEYYCGSFKRKET